MGMFGEEEKLTAWDVKALLLSVEKSMEFGVIDAQAGGSELLAKLKLAKSITIERFNGPEE